MGKLQEHKELSTADTFGRWNTGLAGQNGRCGKKKRRGVTALVMSVSVEDSTLGSSQMVRLLSVSGVSQVLPGVYYR